jgi:hypothetical protein
MQFCLKENTMRLHYNDQLVNSVYREIITVHSENQTKQPINALCGQNTELLNVKAGTRSSYQRDLKGYDLDYSFFLNDAFDMVLFNEVQEKLMPGATVRLYLDKRGRSASIFLFSFVKENTLLHV